MDEVIPGPLAGNRFRPRTVGEGMVYGTLMGATAEGNLLAHFVLGAFVAGCYWVAFGVLVRLRRREGIEPDSWHRRGGLHAHWGSFLFSYLALMLGLGIAFCILLVWEFVL